MEMTPEELAAEHAATQEVKEDEVRASIIADYGFDEEADKERIDKLTEKEVESRKKLSTAIGQKIRYREDLRKKGEVKPEVNPEVKELKTDSLSERDLLALMKADVADEDIDEVKGYAKYRNISVSDALKDKTMKSILDERVEERKSAQAVETKGARKPSTTSPDEILNKASRGELPDKDEDIEKLAEARIAAKTIK